MKGDCLIMLKYGLPIKKIFNFKIIIVMLNSVTTTCQGKTFWIY